jgi:hypothetical protein
MFTAEDERNLIEDASGLGVAILVLLGIRPTNQKVTFDRRRGQFIVDGRRINWRSIQQILDRSGRKFKNEMRRLTQRYFEDEISASEWEEGMNRKITSGHWIAGALALGGVVAAMASSALINRINKEKGYLAKFRDGVDSGKVTQARGVYRAGSYADAMRVTHSVIEQANAVTQGARRAYRILTAKESCEGCLEYGEEWMPVEDMPPIGSQDCGSHCQCVIVYEYRTEE